MREPERVDPGPLGHDGRLRVEVGISTYRRPALLAQLLPAVQRQLAEVTAWTGGSGGVLVIDNDPDGSAEMICSEFGDVRYVLEAQPGIAAARHRALSESVSADLLQFIDDDEEPESGWLRHMVQAWLDHDRPAVVAGSVQVKFTESPSPWVIAGRFFERPQRSTGSPVKIAPAGNMLIDVQQVRRLGVQFDPRLGMHGGEDSLFTTQVDKAGGRMVFCRESVIYDLVPPERISREWVLQRSWHHGQVRGMLRRYTAGSPPRRVWASVRGVGGGMARIGAGYLRAAFGLVARDATSHARGLRLVYKGRGMISGAMSDGPAQYRRTAGSTS